MGLLDLQICCQSVNPKRERRKKLSNDETLIATDSQYSLYVTKLQRIHQARRDGAKKVLTCDGQKQNLFSVASNCSRKISSRGLPQPTMNISSSRSGTSILTVGLLSAIGVISLVLVSKYRCRSTTKQEEDDDDFFDDPNLPTNLPTHVRRAIYKEERRKASVRFLAMKKPMYDNIVMYGPQGDLLCTISQKKAFWYVRKNLGKWKDKKNSALQLLFTPKGKSSQPSTYNKTLKENICVCCGEAKHHMRHYVVPYCYRSLLPGKYKSHMSHDVVILCPDCHVTCGQETQKRQKTMENALRKDPETAMPLIPCRILYHTRSCALALLRHGDQLPPSKRVEFEELVKAHNDMNGTDKLTNAIIQATSEIETKSPNAKYIPGAKLVVDRIENNDEMIGDFIRNWRIHFLETMQPRHLPKGWDVDNPVHSDDQGA